MAEEGFPLIGEEFPVMEVQTSCKRCDKIC